MRRILSLFTIIFFVFSIFVYGKSSSNYTFELKRDNKGVVLGVSEDASDASATSKINSLPVVADVVKDENLPPVKNDKADDYNLKSGKAALMDCESGEIIYNKDSDKKVAIASITKLATALVFLKNNPKLDSVYEVKKEDRIEGGMLHLRVGDLVEINDLLNLSLVASDNMATMALVNASGMSVRDYIKAMNDFAKENGLNNTSFEDAIGLDSGNVSTAVDVAKLANLAFANEKITEVVAQKSYAFKTKNGRAVTAQSTDILLNQKSDGDVRIIGGKTGFTNLAGYCFVGKFVDEKNNSVISVILDDSEKSSRFYQAKGLAEWAYDNFLWSN